LGGSVDVTQKILMDDWKKRKRTSGANKTRWSNEWEICVEGNYSPANEKGPFHETPKTQRVGALAWGRRSFSSAFGIFSIPKNRNFPFVFFFTLPGRRSTHAIEGDKLEGERIQHAHCDG